MEKETAVKESEDVDVEELERADKKRKLVNGNIKYVYLNSRFISPCILSFLAHHYILTVSFQVFVQSCWGQSHRESAC